MTREFSLSEVKARFPEIVKGVETREEEVVVTRKGRPAAIILNYEEFQRYRETVDILMNKKLMRQIQESRSFYKRKKKGLRFEDVFGEPLK